MPQEYNVLCCFYCKLFQFYRDQNMKKWRCRYCYAKQIIQHVFFKGQVEDCNVYLRAMKSIENNPDPTTDKEAMDCEEASTSKGPAYECIRYSEPKKEEPQDNDMETD